MGFGHSPSPTDPLLPSKDYQEELRHSVETSDSADTGEAVHSDVRRPYEGPSETTASPDLANLVGSSEFSPTITRSTHQKLSSGPPKKRLRTNENIEYSGSEAAALHKGSTPHQPSKSHPRSQIGEHSTVTSDISHSSVEEEAHSADETTIVTQKSPHEPPATVMGGISPLLERQMGGAAGFGQQPLFIPPSSAGTASAPVAPTTSPSHREYMPYWQMFPSPTPPSYEYPEYQMLPQYYFAQGGRTSSASPGSVARSTDESTLHTPDPGLQRPGQGIPRYVPITHRSGHRAGQRSPYSRNYAAPERWEQARPEAYREIPDEQPPVSLNPTTGPQPVIENAPGPSRAAFDAAAAAATAYHRLEAPNMELLPLPPPLSFIRTSALYQAASSWGARSGKLSHSSQHVSQSAKLVIDGNLNSVTTNWTHHEEVAGRRIVWFTRYQEGAEVRLRFKVIEPDEWASDMTAISCIFERKRRVFYVTSVDCITLLELIIDQKFSVEEKNRIRRNLEVCKPTTVSKNKPELAHFFSLIMSFGPPRPRNIEKDVKVFPWSMLEGALKKIVSKYSLGRRQDNQGNY